MITAALAGCLTFLVLSACRIHPDHRLRRAATPGSSGLLRVLRPHLRRRRRSGPADLAGWCDALAREVRAGASLGGALRSVTPPDGTALSTIPRCLARGKPLVDALAVPVTTTDEHAVLTVLDACAHHGGSAAQPLDQVAATLRRRAADAAERDVHSAQARLSALVMTVLPGAVLVLLVVTSPSVRTIAATPLGATIVMAGLALNVAGWAWMRKIILGRRS